MKFTDPDVRPQFAPPLFENVPRELQDRSQWVLWEVVWNKSTKRWTKVPINAQTLKLAKSNDPSTWSPFSKVQTVYVEGQDRFDGIGFVFSVDDEFCGIDFDECLDDNGNISDPFAKEWIEKLNSYTEKSPSFTGLHAITKAICGPGVKRPKVEIYDRLRYFTFTGAVGKRRKIHSRQSEVEELKRLLTPEKKPPRSANIPQLDLSAQELLNRAFSSRNGEKIRGLYEGHLNGHASQSEADLALCSHLAFWSGGNESLVDQWFRSSRLYREKWDKRHSGDGKTYGEITIAKALADCTEFYHGSGYDASARKELNGNSHYPPKITTSSAAERDAALRFVRMAEVIAKPVDWLWKLYIAIGAVTIVEGPPGVGKSTLCCAITAAITRGKGLPGSGPFEPGTVLLCSAEDSKAHTLRPRLDAAGADVSRVFALDEPLTLDSKGMLHFEAAVIEYKPKLVYFDPFFAYTGSKKDIHRANEMREVTAWQTAIAEKYGCAILDVRHLAKSRGQGHALNAGVGSIDLVAAARSVLLVGQDPDDGRRRAMVQIKNNLGPVAPAIGFTLEDGNFYWTGESDLTADRLLSLAGNQEERSAVDEAVDFLREALASGDRETSEVMTEARRVGISDKTLRNARERLKLRARRVGLPGTKQRFYWSLSAKSREQEAAIPVEKEEVYFPASANDEEIEQISREALVS